MIVSPNIKGDHACADFFLYIKRIQSQRNCVLIVSSNRKGVMVQKKVSAYFDNQYSNTDKLSAYFFHLYKG